MKKTGRKLICGALALALVFSLAACGQKDKTEGGDPASVMLSAQQELKKLAMPIKEACIPPAIKRDLYRQLSVLLDRRK